MSLSRSVASYFFLVIYLLGVNMFAQLNSPLVKATQKMPNYREGKGQGMIDKVHLIKFHPLGLADPLETNLTLGYERKWHKSWAAGIEFGKILYSRKFTEAIKNRGTLYRPYIRYYVGKNKNQFLEMEFHYKVANNGMYDFLAKDVVNNIPSYTQLQNFTIRKRAYGMHFKYGLIQNIANHKLFLEENVGFGFRYRKIDLPNEPNSVYRVRSGFSTTSIPSNSRDEEIPLPIFNMALKLVYKVN